ncbi:MAG TPA: hypothetical protein VK576_10110, partial [Thermoleophilia bacterium]|nr:hypothetical protein [Thermoleophilia bacterium]
WWSTDVAGNVEGTHTGQVKIDATAPVTTSDADSAWHHGDVTVHLTASDEHDGVAASGVTTTMYSLDGADFVPGMSVLVTAPAVPGVATHTVDFYSIDAAGNREGTKTAQVNIDTSPIPGLATAGHNRENRATASWNLPSPWQATGIELSNSPATRSDGGFVTWLDGIGLTTDQTSWTSHLGSALRPGRYYIHLSLYNPVWGEWLWSPVKSFTVAKTARPRLYWKSATGKYVRVNGGWRFRVTCRIKVVDDSWGHLQLKMTEHRYSLGGKLQRTHNRRFVRKSPRTLGSSTHTYKLVFYRDASCAGLGIYLVTFKVVDQEYNVSSRYLWVRWVLPL